jgi:hypothetical protein
MSDEKTLTDEQREILDALAEMIIPADDLDAGLEGAGFAGIMETRNKYQPWMGELYDVGLRGLQQASQAFFGMSFLQLDGDRRARVLQAIADGNSPGDVWTPDCSALDFYVNLHNDACFVYCTQDEVWEEIGFLGASFPKGGYPDYADPQ